MRCRIACAAGVAALPAAKKPTASWIDRSSTSAMSSRPSRYFSTDGWNRRPSQSSQTVVTPAIMARSV
jgi:hypothetical protein